MFVMRLGAVIALALDLLGELTGLTWLSHGFRPMAVVFVTSYLIVEAIEMRKHLRKSPPRDPPGDKPSNDNNPQRPQKPDPQIEDVA